MCWEIITLCILRNVVQFDLIKLFSYIYAKKAVDQTIAGAVSGENTTVSPKGSSSQAKGQKTNKCISYTLFWEETAFLWSPFFILNKAS